MSNFTEGRKTIVRSGLLIVVSVCILIPAKLPAQGHEKPEWRIPGLISDLASDDRAHNAVIAIGELREIGSPAVAALESALASRDHQQRQLAAHLLRRMGESKPNAAMLSVTMEGLKDDTLPLEDLPGGASAYTAVRNAAEGTLYLLKHVERARPHLERGLRASDEQQRTLSALVLAIADGDAAAPSLYGPHFRAAMHSVSAQQRLLGAYIMGVLNIKTDLQTCTAILLYHTKDNRNPMDAAVSIQALSRLGKGLLPHLAEAEALADPQQRKAIAKVRSQLRDRPLGRRVLKSSLHCVWFPAKRNGHSL
jgi:hypothetical protein